MMTTSSNSTDETEDLQVKAAIFDIDGTLADTIPLIIAAFRKAVEPLVGRSLSEEEIMDSFGPNEEGSVKSFVPHDYKRGTAEFVQHYQAMHDMCPAPFTGITELLQTLKSKGVRLAVSTGKGADTADLSLKQFNLVPLFEKIETGSPDGSRKVEAIYQILKAFDIPAANTIYIGDSKSDIEESHEAGIKAVAAAWSSTAKKEELKAAGPDAYFETVEDFASWLKKRM